jgi:DNA-binding response OmpR family regulator/nitrogen-specific signal transduction histidine kinase
MLTIQKQFSQTQALSFIKQMGHQPEENFRQNNSQHRVQDIQRFSQDKSDFIVKSGNGHTAENTLKTHSATILIVDDIPNNLQVLFSYLETEGYKILLAEDGETALQIAHSQAPDLILLDILMPEIDGFETCRRLKAKPSTREIPVIFLSALSETVNKVQGFKVGGVDYVTKPIDQQEVLARIKTQLNLQRMRLSLAQQNKELQQAFNFEALVRRVTEQIRDHLDEKQSLQIATEALTEVLNLSSCQIELYDSAQKIATIAYEYSTTLPQDLGATRQLQDFPELYQQLLQKIPIQLVEKIPLINPVGIQVNRLACPIFDTNGIIGNLWALRPPEEVFSALEIRLIQQVASQCAIAIRQARLYEATMVQVEELDKLNRLKDDFIKTISHELKAPMSSIQLATQTMETVLSTQKNPQNSPTFKRVLHIFYNSCERQQQLIDDLLTLCSVDAKAQSLQTKQVDLHQSIQDVLKQYSEETQEQQQKWVVNSSKERVYVKTDPMILERIFKELFNNALKYTPADEVIEINTDNTELQISFCGLNTGVEIHPEEQELIVNSFDTVPNNNSLQHGVSGLGFALIQKLTEVIEASIEVKYENNQTTFCIKFPQQFTQV